VRGAPGLLRAWPCPAAWCRRVPAFVHVCAQHRPHLAALAHIPDAAALARSPCPCCNRPCAHHVTLLQLPLGTPHTRAAAAPCLHPRTCLYCIPPPAPPTLDAAALCSAASAGSSSCSGPSERGTSEAVTPQAKRTDTIPKMVDVCARRRKDLFLGVKHRRAYAMQYRLYLSMLRARSMCFTLRWVCTFGRATRC